MRDSVSIGLHFFCFVDVFPSDTLELLYLISSIDHLTQKKLFGV